MAGFFEGALTAMVFGSGSSDSLIRTKYRMPAITGLAIPRLRFAEKMDRSSAKKVILVLAPSGYGKTTAVIDWLWRRQQPAAWLSLDRKDNDPLIFWKYVCQALGDVYDPSISTDTRYVFSSHELFKTDTHIRIVIDKMASFGSEAFLVLDDIQDMTHPAIWDSLAYLIHYMPSNLHLVLISRVQPRLDLAQLEIKDQMTRLTTEDLQFQRREIVDFFKKRDLFLDDRETDLIEQHSEGWAAALVAAALSMDEDRYRLEGCVVPFKSMATLEHYLYKEVFSSWEVEKQEFFQKTSILDALCGDLCDTLTSQENSATVLRSLCQGNSFLIPMDEKSGWYRYHHLFKEMLFSHLQASSPSTVTDLYRKSAQWHRENGYPHQAIEHYLASGEYAETVRLLEAQSIVIIDSGHSSSALTWIQRLPTDLVENSLEIAAILATNAAENGDCAESQRWISRIEHIKSSDKYASDAARNYASNACLLTQAYCLILQGDLSAVNSILKVVTRNAGAQLNLIKYVDFNPCDISFYRSRMHHLIELYGQQPDIYRDLFGNYQKLMQKNPPGYGSLIAGEYLYEQDRLDESMEHLLEAMEKAIRADCPGVLVPAMVTMARISKARGDFASVLTTLEECEFRLKSIHQLHWNYLLRAFRARMLLESGDQNIATGWFDACKLGPYQDLSRAREFEFLVYARFLIEQGATSQAEIVLRRLLDFSTALGRKHSAVEIQNLLAIACQRLGKSDQATDFLGQSLAIGIHEGYIRSFVDEGERLSSLLRSFSANGKKQKTYIQTLIHHTTSLTRTVSSDVFGNQIPDFSLLTRQEQKVMQLLADGYTNQQIACELVISLSTTKIHIGNIFGKLQVSSRVQCVNKARALGLIA
ncbi:MAG: hypothetical protein EOM08_05135 [Clostridia bacterium]|nr:hypothetical protein [Clostridia bacterium]